MMLSLSPSTLLKLFTVFYFTVTNVQSDKSSYVNGLLQIPDISVPTIDFVPPPMTKISPTMRRYLNEKKSVLWLAEQMGIANYELDHLALHRTLTPHKLITRQKEVIFARDPDALEELELAVDIARDVEKLMQQLRHRYSAAAAQVGTATAMFYYEDDEKSRWVNRFAEAAGITTAFTGAARMIGGGIKAVLKLTWMKIQPKPSESDIAENHQLWVNEEMDGVLDELYDIFHAYFAKASAFDLRQFAKQIRQNQVLRSMDVFLNEFTVEFIRHLIKDFTVLECRAPDACAHGEVIDGVHYRLDVPKDAISFMKSNGIEIRDVILGQNGWEIKRKSYKCRLHVGNFKHVCFPRLKYT